eukprot:scaffold574_cov246-Pinguiococcus_pyrenoidosus.AAC.16
MPQQIVVRLQKVRGGRPLRRLAVGWRHFASGTAPSRAHGPHRSHIERRARVDPHLLAFLVEIIFGALLGSLTICTTAQGFVSE